MKSFEKFKEDKQDIENKIAKLIEKICKEYDIEFENIEFESYRIFADQQNKNIKVKLYFDI